MKFYLLSPGEKFPHAEWADEMDFENTIFCPVYDGHQRPGRRKAQLIIKLPSSKIGDFIWTWYSECIITEKVAELFKKAGFTGYVLKPVVVSKVYKYHKEKDIAFIEGKPVGITKVTRDRSPKPVPPLWEIEVTGKALATEDSGKLYTGEDCPHCGLKKRRILENGIIIDEASWDGSDFLTVPEYPKFILVAQRVKDFCQKKKLTNVRFIRTDALVFVSDILLKDDRASEESRRILEKINIDIIFPSSLFDMWMEVVTKCLEREYKDIRKYMKEIAIRDDLERFMALASDYLRGLLEPTLKRLDKIFLEATVPIDKPLIDLADPERFFWYFRIPQGLKY